MECPFCGFVNVEDGDECAKCHSILRADGKKIAEEISGAHAQQNLQPSRAKAKSKPKKEEESQVAINLPPPDQDKIRSRSKDDLSEIPIGDFPKEPAKDFTSEIPLADLVSPPEESGVEESGVEESGGRDRGPVQIPAEEASAEAGIKTRDMKTAEEEPVEPEFDSSITPEEWTPSVTSSGQEYQPDSGSDQVAVAEVAQEDSTADLPAPTPREPVMAPPPAPSPSPIPIRPEAQPAKPVIPAEPIISPAPSPSPVIRQEPAISDGSGTYTGSDPELIQISRFFRQARKDPIISAPEKSAEPPKKSVAEDSRSDIPIVIPDVAANEKPGSSSEDSFKPEFKAADSFSGEAPGPEDSQSAEKTVEKTAELATLASLSARFFAGLFDAFMGLVILGATFLVAHVLTGVSPSGMELRDFLLRVMLPILPVTLVAMIAYGTFFEGTIGQTPGKMLMDLQVVDQEGGNIRFVAALERSVIYWLCALPLGLGLLSIVFDPDGQGLHDRATASWVIKL